MTLAEIIAHDAADWQGEDQFDHRTPQEFATDVAAKIERVRDGSHLAEDTATEEHDRTP